MADPAIDGRLYVVVGILRDARGRVLIQKRRPGTPRSGQWEFPGGKVENGETPHQALARELKEELGISIGHSNPFTVITHDYDHARVWLDTYHISEFDGEPAGCEGQEIAWVEVENVIDYDVLDAVYPIVEALGQIPVHRP